MMMAVRMALEDLEIRLTVSVTFFMRVHTAAHKFNLGGDYTDES